MLLHRRVLRVLQLAGWWHNLLLLPLLGEYPVLLQQAQLLHLDDLMTAGDRYCWQLRPQQTRKQRLVRPWLLQPTARV
jgi:hypothetical protein